MQKKRSARQPQHTLSKLEKQGKEKQKQLKTSKNEKIELREEQVTCTYNTGPDEIEKGNLKTPKQGE